jgi:hypothetical protein
MDVSLVSVAMQRSLRRADHSSRSPTGCDREASVMRTSWPTGGSCVSGKKIGA